MKLPRATLAKIEGRAAKPVGRALAASQCHGAFRGSELEATFAALWERFGSGDAPARENQFAKAKLRRKWRFDFAWIERKVAVELEGVFRWGDQTRHQRAGGFQDDCEKYNAAVLLGWRVLRFTRIDLDERPLQTIETVQALLEMVARK